MRIISGTARGRKLQTFAGRAIRPTPDRVREAVFSALTSRLGSLDGFTILDLYAGSGALGLEALSRGAETALFIEQDDRARELIRTNLDACGFADRAEVLRGRLPESLSRLAGRPPFDLVFLDPPYERGLAPPTLQALSRRELVAPGGLVCAETACEESLEPLQGNLRRLETRTYGRTAIHLFTPVSHEDADA